MRNYYEIADSEYINCEKRYISELTDERKSAYYSSMMNYFKYSADTTCYDRVGTVAKGDVIYVEFGASFNRESGNGHLAVVLKIYAGKLLVVPLTSNLAIIDKDYCFLLMKGVGGLNKTSVAFLNDAKFISPSRVLNIVGNLGEEKADEIKRKVVEIINDESDF